MKTYNIKFQISKTDPTETEFTMTAKRIQDAYSKVVNSHPGAVRIRVFEVRT